MKRIPLFKPGRHTAASGQTLDFTDAALQAAAAAYDPAKHEAPIVIGHPADNGPAYGWVGALAFADGLVSATPRDVQPAFEELVKSGAFKKVSASWYLPDAPSNPTPGALYLRHVGFLGAQPPALKGLPAVEFSAAADGVVEFSDDITQGWFLDIFQRLRNWMIGTAGLDKADEVVPQWLIDSAREQIITDRVRDQFGVPDDGDHSIGASSTPTPLSYQETPMDKDLQAIKAELEAERAARAAAEARVSEFAEREAQAARERLHAEHVAFADGLVRDARLAPVAKDVVVALLDAVEQPQASVEFGEGDAKKPLATALRELLSTGKRVVDFGEHATDGAERKNVDPVSVGVKAAAYQEQQRTAGIHISTPDAVKHVMQQGQ